MNIAIAGAGMTGAYLYRLLDRRRHTVEIFDKDPGTDCGIKPCAWGASRGYGELVQAAGLAPSSYILRKTDHVIIDGIRIAADLMTIDKSRLIRDLLAGAELRAGEIEPARYDRIIDATGVARAFLPALRDDIILPCVQWRLATDTPFENRIHLEKIGYGWSFPLAQGEHHIGCGSLLADPRVIMDETGWVRGEEKNVRCTCTGAIRLTAPQYAQPFVTAYGTSEVWGVGEAVGCVAPLAGDGIVPGMRSVQILLAQWDDPAGYTRALLKEFAWMEDERRVIDKLIKGEKLALAEAWVLKKNSRRMGMQVGLKEAALLLTHLR